MAIEKAFAIDAAPAEIFAALDRELSAASEYAGDTHEVLRRDPPRSIDLRVTISGMPCHLSYRISERAEGGCEVVATVQPYGWKYGLFRVMTFGMHDGGFAVTLVHSLANLKAAVEGGAFPDEESARAAPADE